ncbi:MAG: peptidoglycan DD-metalloendopeptidase family protein [Rhizobiales bacterium]|nr:peptidoglycan DD-metalloendopeptidase family protein [Hyphomicrobiales bacterium]
MPRSNVPSCSHASSRLWPRVAVLALIGATAAGCSDSARFDSNPYASNARQAPPQQETTGSVASRPAASGRVEAQPLPAPSRPATVAAGGGVANGAQGLGAYRPGTHNSDITGSVVERHAPQKPAGAWTWDGGSPVTVGYGETFETIARKYGVPVSALMQTNGFTNAAAIKPGQRLVIPRYVTGSAQQAPVAQATETVHIVQPGESLTGIARRTGVAVAVLARANNIQPYAKVNAGDRLTIPGGRPLAARQTPIQTTAPQVAQPRTVAVEKKVASAPTQNARMATQAPPTTDTIAKSAEPTGAMPSFRWPVRGRVIAAFGANTNGTQNDGINLAVPAGTPVKAADDGVVAYAGNELKGYGNLVLIRHSNGYVSAYAHASELLVKRGDAIKRGQVIANAGQTGNVTSPQLHFEIRKGSTPVDPAKYLGGA